MKDKTIFLPLLLVYIMIVLAASTDNLWGDEGRYVMYANNLLNGYYAPPGSVNLWNGPGYPILLVPFIKLKLPWLAVKLLNPLFMFMAIMYFYHMLGFYVERRQAVFYSYLLGTYPPFFRYIHFMLTESLVILLVCGFIFHFCKLHQEEKTAWSQILIAAFYLGYLTLTKIFFGTVILIGFLLYVLLYVWRKRTVYKKTFLVYLLALLCCLPYLSYTYSLSGKIFFWGNRTGQTLFLMSTPQTGEYGDWFQRKSQYYQDFVRGLHGLNDIERDDAFKREAFKNMREHPAKYCLNVMANIGRLFFNYPFSYDRQRLETYFYIIPNMFLAVFCVLCLYPSYVGRRLIPFEFYALLLFSLISFGGLSIANSENRSVWPLVPIFLLWISFTFTHIVKIRMRE